MILPYLQGQVFVDALRKRGGWPAVDKAYSQLPESSEQILHPKLYPREKPLPVKVKLRGLPGFRSLGQDTAGEFLIRCWGREHDLWRGLAAGWGGDRFETWESPTEHYTLWETRWDSPKDAQEFADFARPLLTSNDNLVGQGNRVQVWLNIPKALIQDPKKFL